MMYSSWRNVCRDTRLDMAGVGLSTYGEVAIFTCNVTRTEDAADPVRKFPPSSPCPGSIAAFRPSLRFPTAPRSAVAGESPMMESQKPALSFGLPQ